MKSGEVIGHIQTDKATLELEAPGSGTLTGILLEAGGTVPVGVPIAAILKDGESLPAGWGQRKAAPVAMPSADSTSNAPKPETAATSSNGAGSAGTDRVKASPLARKIAGRRASTLVRFRVLAPAGASSSVTSTMQAGREVVGAGSGKCVAIR